MNVLSRNIGIIFFGLRDAKKLLPHEMLKQDSMHQAALNENHEIIIIMYITLE